MRYTIESLGEIEGHEDGELAMTRGHSRVLDQSKEGSRSRMVLSVRGLHGVDEIVGGEVVE